MIEIKQKIKTKYKGQNFTIEPGKYPKLPVQLQNDKDLLHYVNSKYPKGHAHAGQPNFIEGYEMTAEEKKSYKPLAKTGAKKGMSRITPTGTEKSKTAKEAAKGKNKL